MSNPWLMAIRPRTLPAAAAPVVVGAVMAWRDGAGHALAAACGLAGALLIQIGTNLANDYFDFQKGADTAERIGPVRVTQAGLIAPSTVRNSFILAFALAALVSLYLVARGGWPIVAIGIFSIAAGILYTAGRHALGYLGLGDIFVLVFFGPVAVAGTYYVQALRLDPAAVIAGIAPGLLSTAILCVNNLRDIDADRKAGKRTLAVRFGRVFARWEYFLCFLGASLVPFCFVTGPRAHPWTLLAALTLVAAAPVIRSVFIFSDGPGLNNALAATGKALLIYAVLFSIGWCL